jgi:hypothetical protein
MCTGQHCAIDYKRSTTIVLFQHAKLVLIPGVFPSVDVILAIYCTTQHPADFHAYYKHHNQVFLAGVAMGALSSVRSGLTPHAENLT